MEKENRSLRIDNHKLKLEVNQLKLNSNLASLQDTSFEPPIQTNSFSKILKLIPKFRGTSEELRIYITKIEELLPYIISGPGKALFITSIKTDLPMRQLIS